MASVYKRKLKQGTFWFGAVRLRDGSWKKFNTGMRTSERSKREAAEYADRIQAEFNVGLDPFRDIEGGAHFSELFGQYVTARLPFWSPRTARSVQYTARRFVELIGDVPLSSITDQTIPKFREEALASGAHNNGRFKGPLSPHTLNVHLRNLGAFFKWANRSRLVENWAPPEAKPVKAVAPGHRDYYTPDECRRLLESGRSLSISGQPIADLLAVLILTGMRKTEVLSMQWEWIDLPGRKILVPPDATKSNRKRTIPIPEPLAAVLEALPQPHSGRVWPFTGSSGRINQAFRAAQQRAGVPPLKLHNLRDTYAVNLLLSGVPLAVVSRILGHADVNTTIKHYAAIAGDELTIATKLSEGFSTSILPTSCKTLKSIEKCADS
jgi:integrase